MAVHNFGSINIDLVYRVDHLPSAGETIVSLEHSRGLGGKGANMSIAVAAARADIRHYGAVGQDGDWVRELLADRGVDVEGVEMLETPTGHAVIQVDREGENVITLFPGANQAMPIGIAERAVADAAAGDWLLLQNETAHVVEAASMAKAKGLDVAYAAAPFDAAAVQEILPFLDLIAMNAVEAAQLETALGTAAKDLEIGRVIVTRGGDGATLFVGGDQIDMPAIPAKVIDTTGAGDTFFGVYLGCLDRGMSDEKCMEMATKAAAIQVTRPGAASAIPSADEFMD